MLRNIMTIPNFFNKLNQTSKKQDVRKYWDRRFKEYFSHHLEQNELIAVDFLANASKRGLFDRIFKKSLTILEVGCGIGVSLLRIYDNYQNFSCMQGVEISRSAVRASNNLRKKLGYPSFIDFKIYDAIKEGGFGKFGHYDIALCSNVLEHFKDPFPLLNHMLDSSTYCCILVPYNHLDGRYRDSDGVGGEGHVFAFTEETFKNYKVLDSFKFKTNGWKNVTDYKNPMQFATLLKGNL